MIAAAEKYLLLIFGEDSGRPKHWTRYFNDRAEALKVMDQAIRNNFSAELYQRFANCEYRRIY